MKERDKIYFVVVFYFKDGTLSYEHLRCWGWYKEEAEAEAAIRENRTDIYERGYYNYALIEPMHEGIAYRGYDERWFKVDYVNPDEDVYNITEVPKPLGVKNIVGFSYA
jgi:hypothetical protein